MSIDVPVPFSRNISYHTQYPPFSPQYFLFAEDGNSLAACSFSLVVFTLVKKDRAQIAEYPGLPKTQTQLCEETQGLFTICERFSITPQCLVDRTPIVECRCVSFFVIHCMEASQYLFDLLQCFLVASVAATDLAEDHLHPCRTVGISGITKELNGFLGIRTCLLKVTLLAKKHREFIESPTCLVRFMHLAMEGQAACETAQSLGITTLLAQNRAKATLYAALTSFITQVQSMPSSTAQH